MTAIDESRRIRIDDWCRLGGFPVEPADPGRLRVAVDSTIDLVVEIEVGQRDEPVRVHDRFTVAVADVAGLTGEVVERVVLGRSAMIDARVVGPGTVETVVAVYPDGLSRHAFMTAVFEVQKVRDLVRQEAAARAEDAVTVAELERLIVASGEVVLDREG